MIRPLTGLAALVMLALIPLAVAAQPTALPSPASNGEVLVKMASKVPAAFSHAIALRGCTQEDAPALEVFLTHRPFDGQGVPPKPYLHVEVAGTDWRPLVGRSLQLVPLSRRGLDPQTTIVRAELGRAERLSPIFLSGALRLANAQPDRPVEGKYDFTTQDGERWAGTFRAHWVATRGSGCG